MTSKLKFAILLSATATTTATAFAQSAPLEGRVGKLEKEMKAVQRSVFPQGVPVQPDIVPDTSVTPAGNAATTPIADLSARVDALEKSFTTLTGQVEQLGQQNRLQDDAIKALQARDAQIATAATAPVATPAFSTTPPTTASERPATTKADPAHKAALAAVEMPATGDGAEDAYTYGYRLYAAKLYPEAQAKLKDFVAKYPTHRRASYAQNLLGRAYLDEGKPALASVAFYDNYQKMPKGERAPESLYWLGQSLTKLKKLPDACKVYDELSDVYGKTLTTSEKTRITTGRVDAKCAA